MTLLFTFEHKMRNRQVISFLISCMTITCFILLSHIPQTNAQLTVKGAVNQVAADNNKTLTNIQNTSKLSSSNKTSVSIVTGAEDPTNVENFVPKSITVSKGTTLLWTNDDYTLHTVTSGSPQTSSGTEFDSSYFGEGETFEWTFEKSGVFEYYCTLHPFMAGTVNVN